MTYVYQLLVIDDMGDVVVEHDLTPDEAVTILAKALAAKPKETPRPVSKVASVSPSPRPTKGAAKKSARKCSNCRKPGHIARHCPLYGHAAPQEESKPKPTEPLTAEQYAKVRSAMHDKEFQSAKYSLTNKLSPREVNAAVRSSSYQDYLASRSA